MRDELPRDELKTIWQNQPTGTPTMTMKLIRSKARELQAKTRRQLLGTMAGPLAAAFFYAFGIREFPRYGHVLHPLFAFALVWSLVGLYFLNRGMWSTEMPGDAGLSTGLEFCRARDRAAASPPAPAFCCGRWGRCCWPSEHSSWRWRWLGPETGDYSRMGFPSWLSWLSGSSGTSS